MDRDGWHKSMSHFASMCCSYPLNTQGLFYDDHESHFDDRELYILCTHNIQCFILRAGEYVHDQPNNNSPNMNIKNLYGNARMNWMRHHGTLKSKPPQNNYVLVETWESFIISSTTITYTHLKNTHILPLPTRYWHQPPNLSC